MREKLGGIGIIVLAFWLIYVGLVAFIGLAIPDWVGALAAAVAGILILVGK